MNLLTVSTAVGGLFVLLFFGVSVVAAALVEWARALFRKPRRDLPQEKAPKVICIEKEPVKRPPVKRKKPLRIPLKATILPIKEVRKVYPDRRD